MNDREFLQAANIINTACNIHFLELLENGIDKDVAANRTFDVIRSIYEGNKCFDMRDRLFQQQLITAIKAKAERERQ